MSGRQLSCVQLASVAASPTGHDKLGGAAFNEEEAATIQLGLGGAELMGPTASSSAGRKWPPAPSS